MTENVKDLAPAPYNPRKISEEALERLRKSMKEFGDLSGIIFNRKTGNLIGGHQRVKILDPAWPITKAPQEDSVGTVAAGHIETPFGKWIYREVFWSREKEIAANIAANKHGGEFDYPKLKDLIVQIDTGAFDLDLTGFSSIELSDMFGYVKPGAWGDALGGLPEGDKPPFRAITFTVHEEQFAEIEKAISAAKALGPFVDSPNENSNGNALARICESFLTFVGGNR